ncbi:MAG: HPP family protein [Coxiellaceae bacterium]|nr:HPP family protein [Coxiellaceae bacterium]
MKWSNNEHLKVSKSQMILQLILAMGYVLLTLFLLDIISESPLLWAVGASSLASSAYLIFASPCTATASAKRLIGAYFIAIVCGIVVRHLSVFLMNHTGQMFIGITHDPHMYWLSGTVSVGLSMMFMLIFGMEHPPATGIALILVIDQRSYQAIIAIFLLAVLLAIIKAILRKRLCDVT